ncbi:MAG: hormogonium polysaccharide biosynthesis protein HpsA [Phormidesmis sp.]
MSADKPTRDKKNHKPRSNFQRLSRRFMSGLLRSLFFINKPARHSRAGFVLPATALLLLVMTLTVGALSFRTFSRSSNVAALRAQQTVDAAAAPAIDRAKSKLEYLFSRDTRFPGGIPSSDVIVSMMLNDGTNGIPQITANDPYTFPDENRVDINGSGDDNAWVFSADVDGDGNVDADEIVVYSVLMDDENGAVSLTDDLSQAKADALVTRNGPINTGEAQSGCGADRAPEAGWQVVSGSSLQKNFQVTAFVANRSDVNRTASALDFQQVRQADRGNKWGAWFKYDLELFPGASRDFFWNGAMHTEGNFIVRDKYIARMISSHNSCLYTQDAAEITLASDTDFEGQVLSAKTGANNFFTDSSNSSNPLFHLFTANATKPDTGNNGYIDANNDSVTATQTDLRNILLDPIKLFTEDKLAHRSASGWSRDANWLSGLFVGRKRIYNENTGTPYLDDTYRADNRYGPKAVYDDDNAIPSGSSVGDKITTNTTLTALDAANDIYGLDGYWERRAIGQGLRIIVGQRLELGNTFGWDTANEPLFPVENTASAEVRQRRSLYDNLAAVQGMVIYHHETSNGEYPLACIASTAHPGTEQTLINSRDFRAKTLNGNTFISNFLTGKGTNGWEYDFPATFLPSTGGTAQSFGAALDSTRPLGIALRNLSHFAGDPNGGAPSFKPVQDNSVVHPYPNMAMWGNYSVLRRIFDEELDATSIGTIASRYDALSPADKSSLHSAACTLGLLGDQISAAASVGNVDWVTVLSAAPTDFGSDANNIRNNLNNLVGIKLVEGLGMKGGSPDTGSWADTNCVAVPSGSKNWDCTGAPSGTTVLPPTKDEVVASSGITDAKALEFIDLVSTNSQIYRDRLYGSDSPSSGFTELEILGDTTTKYKVNLPNECIPGASTNLDNLYGTPFNYSDVNRTKLLGISMLCASEAKYPSLHYLFPVTDHTHTAITGTADDYIFNDQGTTTTTDDIGVNAGFEYKVVGDDDQDGVEESGELGLSAIAFDYRLSNAWQLPIQDTGTSATGTLDPETMEVIDTDGTLATVSLLDKGMYDGRELLGLRMLDIDINQLSANTNSSDHWIADTDGIVYTFREDAMREDSIVRPKTSSSVNWSDCDTWAEVYTNSNASNFPVTANNASCRMSKSPSAPFFRDPPLMADTLISTKPIDFYPDPGRRPHGFRLVNGETLNRASDVLSGMTFVSDNMVYIKGDFNLHGTAGANCNGIIEEFTDKLIAADCSLRTTGFDFYDDRTVAERNDANFADPAQDPWRPVEIVGDAVGVLSNSFRDGNIEEGFTLARITGGSTGTSSYQNQNRLNLNADSLYSGLTENSAVASSFWKHADPTDTTTPIVIDRNGGLVKSDDSVVGNSLYIRFSDSFADFQNKRGYDLQPASRTIVNAVFISGIIPSQAGQTYGGMHNFPRFLEQWDGVDHHIAGGFFQLNFSTSATAPFDQDAWEAGTDPTLGTNAFRVRFYGAPNRIWGYDVGLQYAPAGPIARRFVTVGTPRSEFYRDLPVDDPYVKSLRCATYKGSQVDPTATCSP